MNGPYQNRSASVFLLLFLCERGGAVPSECRLPWCRVGVSPSRSTCVREAAARGVAGSA
jgi:hypothetical protein